ncbi:major capsid protein [Paenibacillus psychroresistens]|uniref:Major capsid protein n=1 Tax=Paenibacillus psychroresistens TaxID=1778678 RepID=A0A6B8RIG4_9BACL|nr:major capsid protein [Paenibacillus psychroresistens]QGQ95859.1 major capsid protein [Paenibacillus psychroresistens]
MPAQISIYDPRVMYEAIINRPPAHTFLKKMFFNEVKTFDTPFVDVDYYKSRRKMAPFVSPRLPGKVISREGFITKTYTPPQLKPLRGINGENINKRSLGDTLYTRKSPADRAAELLASDIVELDDSITRREEWMYAQVLFSGQVHMLGEGVDELLDFNFTQKDTLSGTDKWDNAASDPYAQLYERRRVVVKNSGVNPDTSLMASDVVQVFITHPKIKELLDIRRVELGMINPRQLPNGATYIGSLSALGLDIYSYDEWFLDEDTDPLNPTEQPMIPSGHIWLGSTQAKFSTYYGAVTLVDPDTKDFYTVEGDRIPQSWVSIEPPQRFLQINSRPLPVPHEVDSWYIIEVI